MFRCISSYNTCMMKIVKRSYKNVGRVQSSLQHVEDSMKEVNDARRQASEGRSREGFEIQVRGLRLRLGAQGQEHFRALQNVRRVKACESKLLKQEPDDKSGLVGALGQDAEVAAGFPCGAAEIWLPEERKRESRSQRTSPQEVNGEESKKVKEMFEEVNFWYGMNEQPSTEMPKAIVVDYPSLLDGMVIRVEVEDGGYRALEPRITEEWSIAEANYYPRG